MRGGDGGGKDAGGLLFALKITFSLGGRPGGATPRRTVAALWLLPFLTSCRNIPLFYIRCASIKLCFLNMFVTVLFEAHTDCRVFFGVTVALVHRVCFVLFRVCRSVSLRASVLLYFVF